MKKIHKVINLIPKSIIIILKMNYNNILEVQNLNKKQLKLIMFLHQLLIKKINLH